MIEQQQLLCQKCLQREATEQFAYDTLALTHGGVQHWCKLCVLNTQIEFAERAATQLPELKRARAEWLATHV